VTAGVGDIYAPDIAKSNKGFVNIFGTDNVAINKKTGRIKYIANHNPTQNKVDIEFSIDGKPLGASIKNYNLESTRGAKRYGISLVSGTPVWSLIGDKGEFL
jgi:hypothetical protein